MSAAEGRWSRKTAQSLVIQRAVDMEDGGKRDAPEAASRIITVALKDLAKKHGLPPFSEPEDHAAPTLRHVIETDAARFVLAYDRGRPVGFGAGLVRGAFSYCAGLFVLPEWQGRGLGRRLFETALEGLPIPGGITALTLRRGQPHLQPVVRTPRHLSPACAAGPQAGRRRRPADHQRATHAASMWSLSKRSTSVSSTPSTR